MRTSTSAHLDVVRHQLERRGCVPGPRRPRHGETVADDVAEPAPDERVIVDDQDLHEVPRDGMGRRATTSVPPPAPARCPGSRSPRRRAGASSGGQGVRRPPDRREPRPVVLDADLDRAAGRADPDAPRSVCACLAALATASRITDDATSSTVEGTDVRSPSTDQVAGSCHRSLAAAERLLERLRGDRLGRGERRQHLADLVERPPKLVDRLAQGRAASEGSTSTRRASDSSSSTDAVTTCVSPS